MPLTGNTNQEVIAALFQTLLDSHEPEYDYYGLPVYKIDGCEYAVAADWGTAKTACKAYIRETVWAFRSSFLASYVPIEQDTIEVIQEKCEGANKPLLKLIEDFDAFADDAIGCDGVGHFLASYDGEEIVYGDIHVYCIG